MRCPYRTAAGCKADLMNVLLLITLLGANQFSTEKKYCFFFVDIMTRNVALLF